MQPEDPPGFKPGDRVLLKSGGPGMTVLDVGRYTPTVWCRWDTPGGGFTDSSFPAACLKPFPVPTGRS